jgi:hypothetical protein
MHTRRAVQSATEYHGPRSGARPREESPSCSRSSPSASPSPPRAKGISRDRLIPLSPCSRSFVPERSHSTSTRASAYAVSSVRLVASRSTLPPGTRGSQRCCSALVLAFQVFLGAAAWARVARVGTWMQRPATRGRSSHRRRRRRRAARPCRSTARRLCSARQAPRASTAHSEYVARLVAFVSPWRGRVLVVVSSLVSLLGCAGAQGSEVPAERGGGLLREGVPRHREAEAVSAEQNLTATPHSVFFYSVSFQTTRLCVCMELVPACLLFVSLIVKDPGEYKELHLRCGCCCD